jgi:hypothetical protein
MDVSGQLHGHFAPGEKASGTHWIGGWVGPRAGLDGVERGLLLPSSLYQLSYLGALRENYVCT